MRKRSLAIAAIFLGVIAATCAFFLMQRHPAPAHSSRALREAGTPPRTAELGASSLKVAVASRTVEQAVAPEPAKRHTHISVRVKDLFGQAVVGAMVRIGFGEEMWHNTPSFKDTDQEGIASREVGFNPDETYRADVRVQCGYALMRKPQLEGRVEFEFPPENCSFGEVDIQPPGWHGVGIRLVGEKHWTSADATDRDLGERFLFVTPGEYEITDDNDGESDIGRIRVQAHQRSTFTIHGRCALQVAVKEGPETEIETSRTSLTLRGVTQLTSYGEGCEFVVYGPGTRSFYGLAPGVYEITSRTGRKRSIELRSGEVTVINIP